MSNAAEIFAAMAEAVGGPDGTRLRRKFKVGTNFCAFVTVQVKLGLRGCSPSDLALS